MYALYRLPPSASHPNGKSEQLSHEDVISYVNPMDLRDLILSNDINDCTENLWLGFETTLSQEAPVLLAGIDVTVFAYIKKRMKKGNDIYIITECGYQFVINENRDHAFFVRYKPWWKFW